ncbi:hypothetical protein [Deinococcus ruber]|uniref:Uncharacterized protein n=1 Tax=Deinococcus ruber TaxID=1848197 RepID=A0A918F7W4_9DEIO|nr:hypothetical protein [Deinococcus ruber]GGR09643.1 hypothetical protein GCM10008957_22980 [Deinococcus ruber]
MSQSQQRFHRVVVGSLRAEYFTQADGGVLIGLYRQPARTLFAEAYLRASPEGSVRITSMGELAPDTAALAKKLTEGG